MVTTRRNRRGGSSLGCLVSLLLTAVVLYYGIHLGQVWWRYYELVDRMKIAARFANNETDDQILKQLQADAVEVGVPKQAQSFKIVRTEAPRQIRIRLPFSRSERCGTSAVTSPVTVVTSTRAPPASASMASPLTVSTLWVAPGASSPAMARSPLVVASR